MGLQSVARNKIKFFHGTGVEYSTHFPKDKGLNPPQVLREIKIGQRSFAINKIKLLLGIEVEHSTHFIKVEGLNPVFSHWEKQQWDNKV